MHQLDRFEQCGPQRFRIGDIVEVQVSFMVVPLKKDRADQDRRKMVMVLRSMALLDGQFVTVSEVWEPIRHKSECRPQAMNTKRLTTLVEPQPLVVLKRKVGYRRERTPTMAQSTPDDTEAIQLRAKRMALD